VVIRDGRKKTVAVELGSKQEVSQELKRALKIKLPKLGDPQTYSFSIPSFNRARLGVRITGLSEQLGDYFGAEDGEGALITEVLEDTPAEKGGLKAGDVITRIEGEDIESTSDVYEALEDRKAGDQVDVRVLRKGQKKTIKVELEEPEEWHAGVWAPKIEKFKGPHGDVDVKVFSDFDQEEFQQELSQEMDQLRQELQELKKELKELRKELR
jgi:C-terminal processing protease CtpA/Prc